MVKNYLYINLVPSIFFILTIIFPKTTIIGYILIDLYAIIYLKHKVSLCITNRIIRLIITLNILIIFIIYPPTLILLEYFSIIILFFMNYFEKLINYHYIKECTDKLNKYKGIKIAITGSYGKTTTKHILYEALKKYYPTLVMPKSYNTPLGISKIINSNNLSKYNIIIFEMGATKVNDIEFLMNMIKPNITIITEIGYMHLDSFKSIQNIINEKCKASDLLNGISVVNVENNYLRNYHFKNKIVGYGINYGLYRIKIIDNNTFELYKDGIYLDTYYLNMAGTFNMLNMTSAIIVMKILGLDDEKIKEGMLNISNFKARLEIKKYSNMTVINDGFNSNLIGAIEAVRVLDRYSGYKIIITPLFVEMKIDMSSYYEEMISKCNLVLLIGYHETKNAYNYLDGKVNVYVIDTVKEAFKIVSKIAKKMEVVVLIENDLPDIYKRGF